MFFSIGSFHKINLHSEACEGHLQRPVDNNNNDNNNNEYKQAAELEIWNFGLHWSDKKWSEISVLFTEVLHFKAKNIT